MWAPSSATMLASSLAMKDGKRLVHDVKDTCATHADLVHEVKDCLTQSNKKRMWLRHHNYFYKLDHNYKSTKHLLRMFFVLLFFIPFVVTGPRLHAFSRPPVSGSEKLKEGLFWLVWSVLCSTSTFNILTPYLSFHIQVLTTLTMFTQMLTCPPELSQKISHTHTYLACIITHL